MESTEAIKSAVLSEHTLAFLPYMAVKKELYQKHLKVIALEDFDIDCNIYSIHRTRSAINSAETYAITMYFINTVNKSIC